MSEPLATDPLLALEHLERILARSESAEKWSPEVGVVRRALVPQDNAPIEINSGVTIQMSGAIALPTKFISLNAMTDADNENCDFTIVSFAMTEDEARAQLNQFLAAIIAKLQSELGKS